MKKILCSIIFLFTLVFQAKVGDLIKIYEEVEILINQKYKSSGIKKYAINKLDEILNNTSLSEKEKIEKIEKFIKELDLKSTESLKKTVFLDDDVNLTKSILIFKGNKSRGSAFLTTFKGKKVAITNMYVLFGQTKFGMYDYNNNKIEYNKVVIPTDGSDIVFFILKDQEKKYDLLKLSDMKKTEVKIGSKIINYGNNQGSGVLSKEIGEILAVGPKEIETNLNNVQGSSGSPTILQKNKEVIAIETRTEKHPETWLTKGSRFADKRQFSLRIDTIKKFKELDMSNFYKIMTLFNKLNDEYQNFMKIEFDITSKLRKYEYAIALVDYRIELYNLSEQYIAMPQLDVNECFRSCDKLNKSRKIIMRFVWELKNKCDTNVPYIESRYKWHSQSHKIANDRYDEINNYLHKRYSPKGSLRYK